MKRLCLMALSLLMLSFNAFAQVNVEENDSDSKWFTFREVQLEAGKWNFIGLLSSTNFANATADAQPSIGENNKLWALSYDYQNERWDGNYLTYDSEIPVGDGVFVWVENNTTLRLQPATENVQISRTIYPTHLTPVVPDENSKIPQAMPTYTWLPLSNPFGEPIFSSALLTGLRDNISVTYPAEPVIPGFPPSVSVQGNVVYTYNVETEAWDTWDGSESGRIEPGQGCFIYLVAAEFGYGVEGYGRVDIEFTLSTDYMEEPIYKNSVSRDFVSLSVVTDGYKVPVRLVQNDMAEDGFDICDARKMFGSGSLAEPYLVCNGIELCKEEVNSENYTATMNIKSFESRSVEIVADNIPEGYSLTLIDGAVEVEMSEGDVYTTDITEGENADRFKLLINKNNVSIADVAEVESVRVVNNNRSIAIYGGKNVRTEVYNALGQKVYETSDRTFDLNNVASGAYVLKVQDGKSVSSAKIIVR